MAPSYKLSYFRLRARAEPARLIFAYAGVDYEDIRIDWLNKEQEWTPVKDSKSVSLDFRHISTSTTSFTDRQCFMSKNTRLCKTWSKYSYQKHYNV